MLLVLAAIILLGLASFGVNPVRPHLGWLGVCLLAIVGLLERLPL